ncbi:hypothetical protein ACOXDI_003315, partial [Acinetobacter baumannii]
SNYSNLHLHSVLDIKSGVLIDSLPGFNPRWRFDGKMRKLSVPKADLPLPVIALEVINDCSCAFGGIQSNGDNWDIVVYYGKRVTGGVWTIEEPPAAKVYIFSTRVQPLSSGVGLEIYREDGTVAFSSQAKPLTIVTSLQEISGVDYLYSGNIANKALLFQGMDVIWSFSMDVDEFYVSTFYGYQDNKIYQIGRNTSDPNGHMMPELYAWFDHFEVNTHSWYQLTAPYPLLIDTTILN